MEVVAEHELSVVLSSHLVADLERVCDYLVVLVASRVQVAGDVDELLATHHRLTGPRRDPASPAGRPARHRGEPHRPAEHAARPHRRARSSTRPGPSSRSAWRTSCSPTWAKAVRTGRARADAWGSAMTWLSWRQFRGQAYVALGLLAVVAIAFAVTGPRDGALLLADVATCASRGDCDVVDRRPRQAPAPAAPEPRRPRGGPGAHRDLLGCSPRRPRARGGHVPPRLDAERHPHPLARRQARRVGLASCRCRGCSA